MTNEQQLALAVVAFVMAAALCVTPLQIRFERWGRDRWLRRLVFKLLDDIATQPALDYVLTRDPVLVAYQLTWNAIELHGVDALDIIPYVQEWLDKDGKR